MTAEQIRAIAAEYKKACEHPLASKTDVALSAATANAWAQMEIAAQLAELNEKIKPDPDGYLLVKVYIEGSNTI